MPTNTCHGTRDAVAKPESRVTLSAPVICITPSRRARAVAHAGEGADVVADPRVGILRAREHDAVASVSVTTAPAGRSLGMRMARSWSSSVDAATTPKGSPLRPMMARPSAMEYWWLTRPIIGSPMPRPRERIASRK